MCYGGGQGYMPEKHSYTAEGQSYLLENPGLIMKELGPVVSELGDFLRSTWVVGKVSHYYVGKTFQ
jgi:hypothetical protein